MADFVAWPDSTYRGSEVSARHDYQEMGASSVSKGGLVVTWLCDQPDP